MAGAIPLQKCLSEWDYLFGTYIESCKFRFSVRGNDALDDLCNCENRSIVRWNGGVRRKNGVGGCVAACLANVEMCSVRMS